MRGAGGVRPGRGLLHFLLAGPERLPPHPVLQHDSGILRRDHEQTEDAHAAGDPGAGHPHDAAGGLRASADEAGSPRGGPVHHLPELSPRSSGRHHRQVPEAARAERRREGDHRAVGVGGGGEGAAREAAGDGRVPADGVHGHAGEGGRGIGFRA